MNPIAGQALEAAREAEASRLAATDQESQSSSQGSGDGTGDGAAASADHVPIHRVEIEAAEIVPSHSGRAERGFVARVHRQAPGHPAAPARHGEFPSSAHASQPETHVFSDHQDLVNFLHHEFAKDLARK